MHIHLMCIIIQEDKRNIMKQTKRQRKAKVPSRPQVTPRGWGKKTSRIFDKQFDRFLYEELYVPVKRHWGEEVKSYDSIFGDSE